MARLNFGGALLGRWLRPVARLGSWARLSIRRRILVAMLAVSVIPLAIFASAGLVALSGLNSGALNSASRQLESSQGLHLADLVQSKAAIVNNELQSIQEDLALVADSAGTALVQPPGQPVPASESSGVAIFGPGATDQASSPQARSLSTLGSQLATIFNNHTEVTCVWVQLPQTGLLAVAPGTAIPSASRADYRQLLPPERYYQEALVRQEAAVHNPNSHWSRLVPAPDQDQVWTADYNNPVLGGATVSAITTGTAADGQTFWIGANITVSHMISEFLTGPPGSAQGSYAFLVSSDGTLLSVGSGGASDLGLDTKHHKVQTVNLVSAHSPWSKVGEPMLLGAQGTRTIALAGEPVDVFFSPMPASQWSLGVALPVSGLEGPVVAFAQQISRGIFGVTALLLPVLLVLALLAVGVTNVLTRRLLRPLSSLTAASGRIAAGDLLTPVPTSAGPVDEIGTLEGALEEMRHRLAHQRDQIETAQQELEQRVESRTAELRRRNQELGTLNTLSNEMSRSLVVVDVAETAAHQLQGLWGDDEVAVYLVDRMARDGLRPVGGAQGSRGAGAGESDLSGAIKKLGELGGDPVQAQGVIVVPLSAAGSQVGVLALRHASPVEPRQLELLKVVGGQLAMALRNAQLFVDTQEMATINERNRIAREIHDTLAQGLAGIIIQLQAAEAWLDRAPNRSQQALGNATALARSSLQEARRSVWALRPEVLQRGGLAGALREELARTQERTGVKTSVRLRGLRQLRMEAPTEVSVFRIVQEAVANSLHHAQPTRLAVEVAREDGHLRVTVTDDGRGFDPSHPRRVGAFGITSMRERAHACGGTVAVESAPGKGTVVTLEVPYSDTLASEARP
ncbi:MAG: histidine kinase [Candidatus Dormibacteria bacterium]